MRFGRVGHGILIAGAWLSASAVQAVAIFHDGFESGTTCAWSYIGAIDSCPSSRLYAHSGSDLYLFDTGTLDVVAVGPFATGGPSLTDIAIDRNGLTLGISLAKIWTIDKSSGAATEIGAFDGATDGLTSLSFVPVDGSDPNSVERLITAGTSGGVYEVNPVNGALTLLGNFGSTVDGQIRAAGDIVSVYGLGTFATVTIGDVPDETDFLASVNTTTWAATPIGSLSIGYDRVFGLGFWGGTFYGFVDNGAALDDGTTITIDPVTGVGTPVQGSNVRWFGAGVATGAPLTE